MKRFPRFAAVSVGTLLFVGCVVAPVDDEPTDQSRNQLASAACSDVSGTNVTRSLAITDATILAKFSFRRVLDQIRTTGNVSGTETATKIFQRWMKTFGSTAAEGDCNDPGMDPNQYEFTCPRAPEATLGGVDPFSSPAGVTFKPVAIMNRFDLAPANGAHCGEYRIVYAMDVPPTVTDVSGRALIIFEAALPNPTPGGGIDACLPIARFWQGLTKDGSVTSRATKLENFYFKGTAVPGVAPVVRAQHYGLLSDTGVASAGQVRTNFFVNSAQWHLREFKLKRVCTHSAGAVTCQLAFAHVTVKTNPANELFTGAHANAAAYRNEFTTRLHGLLSTDVNQIGIAVSDRYNELESIAELRGNSLIYSQFADAAMRSAIATKLAALKSNLTVNNVLDRATTQTCGGCHNVSNDVALGGGLTWPATTGFVHVGEDGSLSPALTTTFLPKRKVVLEKFINDRCVAGVVTGIGGKANDETTVGGSHAGAAN